MNAEQITHKLRLIAGLTAQEIEGWNWWREFDKREPFPGEIAALMAREKQLQRKGR